MNFLLALGYFTTLAGVFLWKLIPIWNSAIPGGLEDTRLFLWNAWWFHHAISTLHTNPYHTTMLFHPFGTSLIAHDFPLWMNLVTYFGQRQGLTLIGSSNLWFVLTWILVGFCTYGLAREVTGEPAAALVAGTYAMTHSYTLARAMQNWGQFNVYGIALFLWMLVRARRTQKARDFVLAGVTLAWTAACHYYFLIYSVLVWLAILAADLSPYSLTVEKRMSPIGTRKYLLGLAITAGLAGAAVAVHPSIIHFAGISISMTSPENPVFLMWVLLMAWGASFVSVEVKKKVPGTIFLRHHVVLGTTTLLLLSPLFWEALKLIRAGGYPKQSILWKTHLPGANLLALFTPNPLHAIWGPWVSRWFTIRGMNPQEQAASIGWVCIAVLAWSRLWKQGQSPRRWLGLALMATVLSMGTHLHVAQYNLWCPLPFFGFRLMPILGNVRVPERWMAVGAIAWAVVLAIGVTKLKTKRMVFVLTALILIENWPGIPFQAAPPMSSVYDRLRQLPPGAVLPMPLYIGDSSIGIGDALNGRFIFPWDHLWAQTVHQKPILGGYVGRISRKIIDSYKADPFIHTLLDLEERNIHNQPPEPAFGEFAVRNLKFRYVLIYPESTDPEALKYVRGSLPLELVDRMDGVELCSIKDYRSD